ncbi:hypothetical protein [Thermotoga sp. KOL6]|uniref:hypothetical protein n=1 Tax=Thermotoga sp. KOL6 TaxID=126741 RepID=UPI000C76B090|nr:hypothetical protein [Thermotoga sp. KOL6]PLV59339.1 hypothetical protein AS005_06255 [Thermotoga sp. KOL6]
MARQSLKKRSDEELSMGELFEKYHDEILKKTFHFFKKYKYKLLSFEDLYQTICYLFCYACKTWKKEKGNFIAHFKCTVDRKMNDIIAGRNAPWCKNTPFKILKSEYLQKPYELKDFENI